MARKLLIKIVAVDTEAGMKATEEATIEIPNKTWAMNEMVMGDDPAEILRGIAKSAVVSASQSVSLGAGQERLEAASAALRGQAPRPGQKDPLAELFRFDLVEAIDAKERNGGGGRR